MEITQADASHDAAQAIALLPRRTPALPSSDGRYYVASEFRYLKDGSQTMTSKTWKTGEQQSAFTLPRAGPGNGDGTDPDPGSVSWLEGTTTLLWAVSGDNHTKVYTLDAESPDQSPDYVCDLPGDSSQIKTVRLEEGRHMVGFVAPVTAAGHHQSPLSHRETEPRGSGRLYTTMPVRWWSDYYAVADNDRERPTSVFYVVIHQAKSHADSGREQWAPLDPQARPNDVLQGTDINLTPWAPDSFVLCPSGFLISAVSGPIDTGREWRHQIYLVDVAGAGDESGYPITPVQISGWMGMPESIAVSASGEFVAFLQWKSADVCFDHGTIFIVRLDGGQIFVHNLSLRCRETGSMESGNNWTPMIVLIQWSRLTDKVLYLLVEDSGRVEVWKVTIQSHTQETAEDVSADNVWIGEATFLHRAGCVISVEPFVTVHGEERLMITRSDFDTAWVAEILDLGTIVPVHPIDELRLSQVPSLQASHHVITYPVGIGDRSYHVQAFVHKPLEQTPKPISHAYPVMVLVHGGPNDAHRDKWSLTWNPLLWTSRGFLVITPNISGSVGFGLPFAQSIFQNWGGRPYDDIVALLEWLDQNKDDIFAGCRIDTDKVLCSGYSYGGYLMNWIAGHMHHSQTDSSIKFRALAVHGGVFSLGGLLGSDLPLAYAYDFGGFPWEDDNGSWTRWDPSRFARNWSTPMLFTHGGKDCRVPVTEALAAFQVCQRKGITSELLLFPDEAHVIGKLVNRIQWQRKLVEWSLRWAS